MSEIKRWYAENSNPDRLQGGPADVIEGCDLFIGVSGPGIIEAEDLAKMADDAIVFAMANPNPEVMPEEAEPYVRIMATGRSDYPNQINNVLAFPGIFRGALDAGAPRITEEMKLAAAQGIADVVARRGPERGLHHPQRVRPRRRAGRRPGRGRGGPARRHRPILRGDRHLHRRSNETGPGSWKAAMRVLVTGASGFLGSAVCDALLARGDEVVGPDPRSRASPQTEPDRRLARVERRPRSARRPPRSRASTRSST